MDEWTSGRRGSTSCSRGGGHLYRFQNLLSRAVWDSDRVRDAVREHVFEQLGEDDRVLIFDETGFIKILGDASAGVARQYTGTTGKVDNCQSGCSPPTPRGPGGR
jgi:SRSO17 transposase